MQRLFFNNLYFQTIRFFFGDLQFRTFNCYANRIPDTHFTFHGIYFHATRLCQIRLDKTSRGMSQSLCRFTESLCRNIIRDFGNRIQTSPTGMTVMNLYPSLINVSVLADLNPTVTVDFCFRIPRSLVFCLILTTKE